VFGGVLGGVVVCVDLVGVHGSRSAFCRILALLFAERFVGCALSGATLCSVRHKLNELLIWSKSSLGGKEVGKNLAVSGCKDWEK
jgi:hypothetical protein